MGAARLPYQQQNITKPRKRKVPTTFSSDKCFTKRTKTRRHQKFLKSKIQKKMLKKIKAVRLNKQKVLLLQSVSNMANIDCTSHSRSGACTVGQQSSFITSKTMKNSINDSQNDLDITTNGKVDQQSSCVTSGSENCRVRSQSIHSSITEISGELFPANKISPPTHQQQTMTTKRKRKLQTTVDSEPSSKISKQDRPGKRSKPKRQIKKSRNKTSRFHKPNFQQTQNAKQSESHFTTGLADDNEQSESIKTIYSLSDSGTIQSLEISEALPVDTINIPHVQSVLTMDHHNNAINSVCSANVDPEDVCSVKIDPKVVCGHNIYSVKEFVSGSRSMPCLGHCTVRKNMSVIKSKSFTCNQSFGDEVHFQVNGCIERYNNSSMHLVKEPLVGQPDVTNSSVNDSQSDMDIIEDYVEKSNIFELSYSDRTVPIVNYSQLDTTQSHRIQRSDSVTITSISPVTSCSDVSFEENMTSQIDVVPHQEFTVFSSTSNSNETHMIQQSDSVISQSISDTTLSPITSFSDVSAAENTTRRMYVVSDHEVAVVSSTSDTYEALQSIQYSRSFINYPNIASDSVGGSFSDMDIIEHSVDRSDPYELVYLNINSRATTQNNSMVSPTERNFVYESESDYSFERSETYELPEIPLYPAAGLGVDIMEALYREAYGMPEEDDDYDEDFDDEFYDDANDFQSVHEPTMHYYNIYSRCEFFVDMMEFENINIG